MVPPNTEDFQINFTLFEEMLKEKVAAVLINSPNNPSGVVYSTETIKKLADLLRKKEKEYGHEIFIISDEPYREILFEGADALYMCLIIMTTHCPVTPILNLFHCLENGLATLQ